MSFQSWFRSALARHSRRPTTCRLAVESLETREVPATLTPVMSGLDNPRGLAFGPEGALYVAESGRGGDGANGPSLVPRPNDPPVGTQPHYYGPTGAISRLWHGTQERVATGLPSFAPASGVGASGPHDLSFQGRNAFVTVGFGTDPARRSELGDAGAGLGQLVRVQPNGNWQNIADVAAYEGSANPGGGSEINSNLYGVLAEPAGRVVTDAGGNSLLRVAANGDITTLAVFPSRPDGRAVDSVPTSVVRGPDGAYYVGELGGVTFAGGTANVYRVVPGETPEVLYSGFTGIIDLDFGPDGSLYVLQHGTGPFLSGNGTLIRIALDGTRTTLVSASDGLVKPTSVLVGDDGAIYVSNRGIFTGGEVVRVTLDPAQVERVAVNDGSAQRSMVNHLTVTFSREVRVEHGSFELRRQDGSLVNLKTDLSVVNGQTVATLTFKGFGIGGGSLTDGNYTLTVRGKHISDGIGGNLDGDGDGLSGGDRADGFHRLYGDADGDRDGDATDFGQFLTTLGRRAGDAGYLWYFDANGDNRVGVIDLLSFARRFGAHLNS